ncbi:MAG: hypothetical protein WBZ36_20615 [Candidatus Nitrosopolaris sp.]
MTSLVNKIEVWLMLRTYDIHLTASLTSSEKPTEEEIKTKQEVVFFLPSRKTERRQDFL